MPRSSPTRDRILRHLLTSHAKGVRGPSGAAARSLYELAKRSQASFAWVHEVTTGLADRGWLDSGDDLRVLDAPAIFQWWRQNTTRPTIKGFHVQGPAGTIGALAPQAGVPYAITTYYAENQLQGHLFPRRMDAYIRKEDLGAMREALLASGAQLGGTNFRLWMRDDALLLEAVELGAGAARLCYAPVAQVILDLMIEGGSAGEAAEMLVERAYA